MSQSPLQPKYKPHALQKLLQECIIEIGEFKSQIKDMLENGADVNSSEYDLFPPLTALFLSSRSYITDWVEIVQLLLQYGADVNAITEIDSCDYQATAYGVGQISALRMALDRVQNGDINLEVIKLLLDAGADLDIVHDGKTIFQRIVDTHSPEVVELFTQYQVEYSAAEQEVIDNVLLSQIKYKDVDLTKITNPQVIRAIKRAHELNKMCQKINQSMVLVQKGRLPIVSKLL